MELLKDLELADVRYENDGVKAVLVFLDEERGEIREVNFNTQKWDNGSFVDDPEKKAKVDDWCQKYFNLEFSELPQAIGTKMNVYAYENFNSLWESTQVKKFEKDMVGQIIDVPIVEALVDNIGIRIRLEYEGEVYESKMGYADYMETKNQWFVNPQKKTKQEKKFKEKFHIDVEDIDQLVGKNVLAEVRLAMGKYTWIDIKPFPKK